MGHVLNRTHDLNRIRIRSSVVSSATARPAPRTANTRAGRFWRSSVGKKVAVAVSGSILVGYLVLHMLGNLTIFAGAGASDGAQIDRYSEFLRTVGGPLLPNSWLLWAVRLLLITALVVHVVGIVQLRRRNVSARPAGYKPGRVGRTWSSRSMTITGPLLLAFIIFHILQFTTLTIQVDGDMREGAVYSNVFQAFQVWWVVILYIAAVLAVGFHLRHGVWSVSQTLGIDSPQRNGRLRAGANLLTLLVVGGFVSVPVFVWTGVIPAP